MYDTICHIFISLIFMIGGAIIFMFLCILLEEPKDNKSKTNKINSMNNSMYPPKEPKNNKGLVSLLGLTPIAAVICTMGIDNDVKKYIVITIILCIVIWIMALYIGIKEDE